MCLIGFAFDPSATQPLLIASNRDEYFDRPTQAANWWSDKPGIYGGRDQLASGTWMAVAIPPVPHGKQNPQRQCRFAALTNFRDGQGSGPGQKSRGNIVTQLLDGGSDMLQAFSAIASESLAYAGFSAFGFEWNESRAPEGISNLRGWHLSNRGKFDGLVTLITPGVHAVSNGAFDDPWPKSVKLMAAIEQAAQMPPNAQTEQFLLAALTDTELADDQILPTTGVPLTVERALAVPFIRTALDASSGQHSYGTRSSAIVSLGQDGQLNFQHWDWQPELSHAVVAGSRAMQLSP